MAEYYREPAPFPSVPSGQQLYGATSGELPAHADDAQFDDGQPRRCSVRGCGAPLPAGYTRKMCETCRGRHRTYASTKRAKRKMEKAALGSQQGIVVWMPPDDTVQTATSTRSSRSNVASSARHVHNDSEPFDFSAPIWDESAIDPALIEAGFSHEPPDPALISNDSELSRALVPALPNPIHDQLGGDNENTVERLEERLSDEYSISLIVVYGTTKRAKWRREKEVAVTEMQKMQDDEDFQRATAGLPPLVRGNPLEWREWRADGTPAPEAMQALQNIPLAPRMCTVSHCREILSGDYKFLRCERHRLQNRYHSKLKRVRDKEVKAQAFDGWAAAASANARAMSVDSHDGIVELSAATSSGEHDNGLDADGEYSEEVREETEETEEGNASSNTAAILSGLSGPQTPFGEPKTGVPPAARGTRRTNHVCSIKACYNLLAPTNPWKMCDLCRAKDRQGRREKALRDSGLLPPPSRPPRTPRTLKSKALEGEEGATKPKKKKKKKKKAQATTEVVAQDSPIASGAGDLPEEAVDQRPSPEEMSQPPSDAEVPPESSAPSSEPEPIEQLTTVQPALVFMDPLLADSVPPPSFDEAPSIVQEQTPHETGLSPPGSDPFFLISADQIASLGAESAATAPTSKKSSRRKKAAAASANTSGDSTNSTPSAPAEGTQPPELLHQTSPVPTPHAASERVPQVLAEPSHPPLPPSVTVTAPPASAASPLPIHHEVPPPGAPSMPSSYMPYYMPPYYSSQPSPYPYTPYQYARPPYGPGPMYQSPYGPYGQPYPYPPPYGQPYAPPPPPSGPLYQVSADFVSRTEYTAASQTFNQTLASYGSSASPSASTYFSAFSAKTGEPHNRPTSVAAAPRRKRHFDQDSEASASNINKRQATAGEHHIEHPAAPQLPPAAPASSAPSVPSVTLATTNGNIAGEPAASPSIQETLAEPTPATAICGNKSCHRSLPANYAGTLCARCKERLKKKQAKVKQRFKLEPRKLLVGRGINLTHTQTLDHAGRNQDAISSTLEQTAVAAA
ncbi:hypothetical protein POSPLADRAFT_1139796 [Postia placenta MAD-698-R-SB12]|uniref:Uncharacterized protein n=1 Tax=Postia placenta MAD-698-R-SB12 TaxID=670580 RepID=A0A1X6N490_9APHY|nr:hypothetical protein POSPLADRAFT_1139796 [Postia placenta MAD-698-R-SB12]OSX63459.1 hypothetical protein POSPLADRAFT_1139796 [Postia placenta MAD-698-R-SB12]